LSYKSNTKNHSVYFTGLENEFWGEKNKIGAKIIIHILTFSSTQKIEERDEWCHQG
jgi:hypothetical protein